jgi:hypothetical protein
MVNLLNIDFVTDVSLTEYINQAVELLIPVFDDDPVYNWFLHTTPEVKHECHYKLLIQAIVKTCGLGGAHIMQAGDWGSCAVLIPPGGKADGLWNIIQAGMVPAALTVGIPACKVVRLLTLPEFLPS